MLSLRALILSALCATAALARDVEPLIARPVTLPRGAVDATLHGTYTNWATGSVAGVTSTTLTGETLSFGLDFGASDRVQLGLATALPINPGAGFGSVLGSALLAVGPDAALRLDAGFERIGFNGDGTAAVPHTNRFFGGIGAPIKVAFSPTLAFVSGRSGAVHFGHFNNVGQRGTGLYVGASGLTELASDFLVLSGGDRNSGTVLGINLPAGLLLQPDPSFALGLHAGFSTNVTFPASGSSAGTQVLFFLPVALEAVVSPVRALDLGVRFSLDGYFQQVGASSGVVAGGPGFFDLREIMLWFRVHAG
ncbi:MAG TPA: hypothetical protein VFL36_02180 [Myxococcales bacterium]|nr:hypothetical protein [Myxococcales bacterium]